MAPPRRASIKLPIHVAMVTLAAAIRNIFAGRPVQKMSLTKLTTIRIIAEHATRKPSWMRATFARYVHWLALNYLGQPLHDLESHHRLFAVSKRETDGHG